MITMVEVEYVTSTLRMQLIQLCGLNIKMYVLPIYGEGSKMMTKSEKSILAKIKRWLGKNSRRYDFWFVYDHQNVAIRWEGGTELTQRNKFRNQYSITPYSSFRNRRTIKNW